MIVSTTELLLEPKKHRLLTPTGHAYASVPIFTFERRGIATNCLIEAKKFGVAECLLELDQVELEVFCFYNFR